MSIINLDVLSNDDLKKHVLSLVDFDDWSDECGACGRPSLLHKGACTRTEKESPDVILKIWNEYRLRVKTVVRMAKSEQGKEYEESLLLDRLRKLMVQINEQNTGNIGKVVDVLIAKKDEPTDTRAARVTKPAKVPSWSKDLSLETYVKQI